MSNTTEDKAKEKVDWARYGLETEEGDSAVVHNRNKSPSTSEVHDLFHEEKLSSMSDNTKPWWKANFFVREPVLFGTWDGVFTTCMINIFGVVIFLRTGWMVGNAGIGLSLVVIVLTLSVALMAALSAIGVCERLHMAPGGIYSLVSSVLGAQIAAMVGVNYCFGQAVAIALYCTGFGDSLAGMLKMESNVFVVRGIAFGILFLLLAINIAGVKWVIKVQLVLILILLISVLDFAVGTFVHKDYEHGFLGYGQGLVTNNTVADYDVGQNFFSVFGVFFPTATGVMAGLNMSGDLRDPAVSIPRGTLMALAVSGFLYILHVVMLGATCTRDALKTDYLIAQKVSVSGYLWLMGLYISSLSSALGGLYGAPRVLQIIGQDRSIPGIEGLGKGWGSNNEPIYAIILISVVSFGFILIGHINTLAPIVALPFILSYCFVDYSYFSLAMSYSQVFPHQEESAKLVGQDSTPTTPAGSLSTQSLHKTYGASAADDGSHVKMPYRQEIYKMPGSWYSRMCNRYLSLMAALASLVIMFLINWAYALIDLALSMLLYVYILKASSGLTKGASQFELLDWIKGLLDSFCRNKGYKPVQVIQTTPKESIPITSTTQLTDDCDDYSSRDRYHHSSTVGPDDDKMSG